MAVEMPSRSEAGSIVVVVLRIFLGWIMFWAFLDKMFGLGFETPSGCGWINGGSPSQPVMYMTSGLFADFYNAIAGNGFIDVLMMAGLLGLGLSLILGFASKPSTVLMIVFLSFMFCIEVPPIDNPLMDYHIIYMLSILAVFFFGGFEKWSVNHIWKNLPIVKDFPILW